MILYLVGHKGWIGQDTTIEKLLVIIKKLKENSIIDNKSKDLIADLLNRGWIDDKLNYIRNQKKK